MNKATLANVLNATMLEYIRCPDSFEEPSAVIQQFLKDIASGIEPEYGEAQAEHLYRLAEEMTC